MWTIRIPNWCPPPVNVGRGRHFSRSHKSTREVCEYLTAYNAKAGARKVDVAGGDYRPVRRLSLFVQKIGKLPDPDNLLKHTLDGAKLARLIVDDSAKWCLWTPPVVVNPPKGSKKEETVIEIEDVNPAAVALQTTNRTPTRQEVYAELTRTALKSKAPALADVLWQCAESVLKLQSFALGPVFTRARVVVRPWHHPHEQTLSRGDFYLHFDCAGFEEVWMSFPNCGETHLARLVEWAHSLGLSVDREKWNPSDDPARSPRGAKSSKLADPALL